MAESLLEVKLQRLGNYVGNDYYTLMEEFLLRPMIPQWVEERGVLHWATLRRNDSGIIYRLDVQFERDRRRGWLNWWARLFCPYVTAICIDLAGTVFACTYYDYRYFQYAEDIKKAYYEKFYNKMKMDMVVVGKA